MDAKKEKARKAIELIRYAEQVRHVYRQSSSELSGDAKYNAEIRAKNQETNAIHKSSVI